MAIFKINIFSISINKNYALQTQHGNKKNNERSQICSTSPKENDKHKRQYLSL